MSSASCSKRAGQSGGELGGLGQRLLAAPAADHGGAEAGQLQGGLAPEAAAGAGDDADRARRADRPERPANASFQPSPRKPIGAAAGLNVTAMKVHVEPQPLHEPLAGGTPGATRRGRTADRRPRRLPAQRRWSAPAAASLTLKLLRALLRGKPANAVPVPAFLIRHPSAGAILVDTGLHPSIATDGKENFGAVGNRFGKPTLEPGEDVPAQLRARGIDPGEIPIVRDDPPAPRPHLGDLRVPATRPSSSASAEWEAATTRLQTAAQRLPPRPLRLRLRLPHGRLRPRRGSTPTPASAAPSTSSATARSGSPSPPATAPATSR